MADETKKASIVVKVGSPSEVLTHITSLTIGWEINAALDRRRPQALRITLTRQLGLDKDHEADQLILKLMRGGEDTAGIKEFPMTIELNDRKDSFKNIGTWQMDEAFVVNDTVNDLGQRITETVTFHAKKVKYKKAGGPETPLMQIKN